MIFSILGGCALTQEKNNKSMFEQALVLQTVAPDSSAQQNHKNRVGLSDKKDVPAVLEWQLAQGETTLSAQHIQDLYRWLAAIDTTSVKGKPFNGRTLILQQGPDWLSSHKRGQNIRHFIPRGLTVRQEYRVDMTAHKVIIKLAGQAEAPARPQANNNRSLNRSITNEQVMALIRQEVSDDQ